MRTTGVRPTIEQGVPLPPGIGFYGPTLLEMRIGESFLVPTNGMRSYVILMAKRLGVPVISRKESGKGFRVWRVDRRVRTGRKQPVKR